MLAGPTRDEAGDLVPSLRHTQGPLHGERGRESRAGPRGCRLCPLVRTAGTASQSQSKKPALAYLAWSGSALTRPAPRPSGGGSAVKRLVQTSLERLQGQSRLRAAVPRTSCAAAAAALPWRWFPGTGRRPASSKHARRALPLSAHPGGGGQIHTRGGAQIQQGFGKATARERDPAENHSHNSPLPLGLERGIVLERGMPEELHNSEAA